MSKLIIIISTFVAVLCFVSCKGNSKSEDEVNYYYNQKDGIQIKIEKKNIPYEFSEELVKLAEDGNAEAQYYLYHCYYNGQGVEKNRERALLLLNESANQGYADAQLDMGLYAMSKCSYDKAFEWFMKAANQDNAKAQQNVGYCYEKGVGVQKNDKEAFRWTKKAAEQGLADAQWFLGDCYKEGIGVEINYDEAHRWYTKSAEQGLPQAQFQLYKSYLLGVGVQQDLNTAIKWLIKAAEQGNAPARYNLAVHYYNGQGLPQEKNKAIRILKELAKEGFQDAAIALQEIGE